MEECSDFSRLSQSRVYENLSYRANVIAYLKAMVLYVAQGEKWDKTIEHFVRWSLKYDLWCKMHFFGDSILNQETAEQGRERRGPQNLLDLLPDEFTRQEAHQLRLQMGIQSGSLTGMLAAWKHRGYIENSNDPQTMPLEIRRYRKTDNYIGKEK